MKKTIALSLVGLSLILLISAFNQSTPEKKLYVTLYYNDFYRECSASYSNGDFRAIPFEKPEGTGNQTQLLQQINEHEDMGYKILQYDYENNSAASNKSAISVLMVK